MTADIIFAAYLQNESLEADRVSLCREEHFEAEAIVLYSPDSAFFVNSWVDRAKTFLNRLFCLFFAFFGSSIISESLRDFLNFGNLIVVVPDLGNLGWLASPWWLKLFLVEVVYSATD